MMRRNPSEFDELHAKLRNALFRFTDAPNWGTAQGVFMAGYYLAPVALREKQVPTAEAKQFTTTVREFARSRVPKDLNAWMRKNTRAIEQLVSSSTWPDKGTSAEQTVQIDGLAIHNQTGKDVTANLKMLETVTTLIRDSGVPRIDEVLYGDVFLVGSIARKHGLIAFYDQARDVIFVLVVKRFETNFISGTIHEFGHRYWNRFLTQPVKGQWARWHLQLENEAVDAFKYRTPEPGDPLEFVPGDPKRVAEVVHRPGKGKVILVEGGGMITLDNYWNVQRANAIRAAYPTLYSARDKEEHFCEALALLCTGELAEPHRTRFTEIFDVVQKEVPAPLTPGAKGQLAMFNPSRRAGALHRRITGS